MVRLYTRIRPFGNKSPQWLPNYITQLNQSHKLILYQAIRFWKTFYYFKLTMKLSAIHSFTFLQEKNEFWLLGENAYITQFCLRAETSPHLKSLKTSINVYFFLYWIILSWHSRYWNNLETHEKALQGLQILTF